jgi:hypothetical protein
MKQLESLDAIDLDNLVTDQGHLHADAIPPVLQASVARHQGNLARLMLSLRKAGMEQRQIEAAVTSVVESYKAELLDAIRSLAADASTSGESE